MMTTTPLQRDLERQIERGGNLRSCGSKLTSLWAVYRDSEDTVETQRCLQGEVGAGRKAS